RDAAILEMDLKLDDLLEKQQDNVVSLDLEYVQLNVGKILSLLNKTFAKRKTDTLSAWGKLCFPSCVQYPVNG
ncbi:14146_t:CDS:2, partial [Dentiscutata heterogama]